MTKFEHLFSSYSLGNLRLPTRIVMCPMTTRLATDTGAVSPEMLSHYRSRTGKGVAIAIVESSYVTEETPPGNLCIAADAYIPRLNSLAETIKENGSFCFIQLNHGGSLNGKDTNLLTGKEIADLIRAFGDAADRAKRSGFDGIEIHGGNVYWLYQLLSPLTNTRKDEFGGDLYGRMRVPLLVVEECRSRVGDDFPISFRFNGDEFHDGGWSVQDSKVLVEELERRKVNLLDITAGGSKTRYWHVQPAAFARGCLSSLAGEINRETSLPVMAVGRINDPVTAERILEEGKADLIGMGRALLVDEDFGEKAGKGDISGIRKCIACNYCRKRIAVNKYPIRCTVNPRVGRSNDPVFLSLPPAGQYGKIWVVGGGLAGMSTACVLDRRGYRVSLFEKSDRLGGQALLASVAPLKKEIGTLVEYYENLIRNSGVAVFLNKEIDEESVRRWSPDVVVVATGAKPQEQTIGGGDLLEKSCWDLLKDGPGEEDTYVIVGGGFVGCETAHFLVEKGKNVKIVERLPSVLDGVEPNTRDALLNHLQAGNVELLVDSELVAAEGSVVQVRKNGQEDLRTLDVEVIAYAVGARSERRLFDEITAFPVRTFLIGDAVRPRGMAEAIFEGSKLGYQL